MGGAGVKEAWEHATVYCDLACLEWDRKLQVCCNPWGVGQGVAGPDGWRPKVGGGDTEEQEAVGLTTEEEAEKAFKEREDWLTHEKQALFQRQQRLHEVRRAAFFWLAPRQRQPSSLSAPSLSCLRLAVASESCTP
jgi:hypothetical protein